MAYKYKAIKINGKKIDEHVYVWEQNFGPIPKGYVVHHKDENKKNNNIDNLEIMTRSEHTKMHYQKNDCTIFQSMTEEKRAEWIRNKRDRDFERSNRKPNDDTSWCYNCKQILPKERFSKNKNKVNGLETECKQCRSFRRSKNKNN